MSKKRLAINMVSSIISFSVNIAISFFLSPYIVKTLGKEAYGFIPLLNNLINIAQILILALNSMAARFITISIHRKDYENANKYFNSLLIANLFISVALLIPAIGIAAYINKLFSISDGLVADVRISFLIILLNFIISLVFSIFSVATFAQNRLDLSAKNSIISEILRFLMIFGSFALLKPTIIYIPLAAVLATTYKSVADIKYTKMLLPQIEISKKYFDFGAIKELISSGIWNSVNKASYMLFSGFDLLFANIFIGGIGMGVLAISKTIPGAINSFNSMIISLFIPPIMISFAKDDIEDSITKMKQCSYFSCVLCLPILAFLVGFGNDFYHFWMPTENAVILQILSIFAILPLFVNIGMTSVGNVFTMTNKLKYPTIATVITAIVSMISVLFIIKFTDLDIYAIAGVSSVCLIIKDVTFTPIYAAMCLNKKITTFYPHFVKCTLISVIVSVISYFFGYFANVKSWLDLVFWAIVSSIVIVIAIILMLFRKKEYEILSNLFKIRMGRKL